MSNALSNVINNLKAGSKTVPALKKKGTTDKEFAEEQNKITASAQTKPPKAEKTEPKKKLAAPVIAKKDEAAAEDEDHKETKEAGLSLYTDKKLGRIAKNLGITLSVRKDDEELPFVRISLKTAQVKGESFWFTVSRFDGAEEKADVLAEAEEAIAALVGWVKGHIAATEARKAEEK